MRELTELQTYSLISIWNSSALNVAICGYLVMKVMFLIVM